MEITLHYTAYIQKITLPSKPIQCEIRPLSPQWASMWRKHTQQHFNVSWQYGPYVPIAIAINVVRATNRLAFILYVINIGPKIAD